MSDKTDPRKLGIPNINYSLAFVDDKNDERYEKYKKQRIERGFDDSELYNLDNTIITFILTRLKAFREYCKKNNRTFSDGVNKSEILNQIIEAFELYNSEAYEYGEDGVQEKVKKGFKLFIDYIDGFWI